MLEFTEFWFFIVAIVFTGVGYYFGISWNIERLTSLILDNLIRDGYLRHRILDDGEVELLKWNHFGQDD